MSADLLKELLQGIAQKELVDTSLGQKARGGTETTASTNKPRFAPPHLRGKSSTWHPNAAVQPTSPVDSRAYTTRAAAAESPTEQVIRNLSPASELSLTELSLVDTVSSNGASTAVSRAPTVETDLSTSAALIATPSVIPGDLNINFRPTVPKHGLVFTNMGKGAHVVNLEFLRCTFSQGSPTIFENCQMMNTIFKDCTFEGFGFKNVVLNGLTFIRCTFKDGRVWTNRCLSGTERAFMDEIFTSYTESDKKMPIEVNEKKTPHPKPDPYKQREASQGSLTGWGVPKGSVYDKTDTWVSPSMQSVPRDQGKRLLPCGLAFDHTPTDGLSMLEGEGQLYLRTIFRRCSFSNVTLKNCHFVDVIFEDCHFKDVELINVAISGTMYQDCKFNGCFWQNRMVKGAKPLHRLLYTNERLENDKVPPPIVEQAKRTREAKQLAISAPSDRRVALGRKGQTKGLSKNADAEAILDQMEDGERLEVEVAPQDMKEKATSFVTMKFI